MLLMHSADYNLPKTADKPARFDFDASADSYDNWYDTAEGKMYDRLEKKAVMKYLSPNTQGAKLLDLGCGTGRWSKFFSDYGFVVTGIDVSERMIETAQSKHIPNASFQTADAHSLPFHDDSFDITAAVTTLEFVKDPAVVLAEMVRCTRKPAGLLLVCVLNSLARLNRTRRRNPQSVYAKARLFSPRRIKKLLAPLGKLSVTVAGFVPENRLFLPIAPFLDMTARMLHIPYGAFIAAQVRL